MKRYLVWCCYPGQPDSRYPVVSPGPGRYLAGSRTDRPDPVGLLDLPTVIETIERLLVGSFPVPVRPSFWIEAAPDL